MSVYMYTCSSIKLYGTFFPVVVSFVYTETHFRCATLRFCTLLLTASVSVHSRSADVDAGTYAYTPAISKS